MTRRHGARSGWSLRLLLYAWLAASVLLPFLVTARISLSQSALAQPPYRPRWIPSLDPESWRAFAAELGFDNYATLVGDDLYWRAAETSLAIAAGSTALLVLVGLPAALGLVRAPPRWRPALLAAVVVPFWTSFLVRVYALIAILKPDGWLNEALRALHLIAEPLAILDTTAAVVIGVTYAYLPFMILPIYAVLERQDPRLAEAASDLGASPARVFWTVTVPLARPGILAGSLLCFVPITGEFVIPDLLGGSDTLTLGRALWSEFFANRDWPLAAAVAVVLVGAVVVPALLYGRLDRRASGVAG